jgi:hypothetical protein
MGNAPKSPVNEPSFDVVHPVSRRPVVARTSNADLPGLAGKKIALVWDYVFRGDDVFRLAKERFQANGSGVVFVDYEVFGDIHGHDELLDQLPSRLEEMGVDGTIVATGA